MLVLGHLLGFAAITASLVKAIPTINDKPMRRVENDIYRRQDVDGEDIETEAATDQLRNGERDLSLPIVTSANE